MNFKNWASKKEEQSDLVDEEGGEAEDGLLLHHRASFLQAGHVELPAEKKTFEGNCCEEKNNEKKHWRLQTNKQTKMLTNRPSLRYSQNMWSWNEELTFPAERWWAGWWWGHPWKPLSSFDQGRSLTENQIPKLFSLLRSNVEGESIKALKVVKSESETKHPQSRMRDGVEVFRKTFKSKVIFSPLRKLLEYNFEKAFKSTKLFLLCQQPWALI